ncbi:hypothetical protein [Methanothrix harundinacea]|uniref:Uncharacterized protein n=1 Tax=Methanothrix harundinacea (strain 6Ac) TaxID=1110509 RepID=G7WNT7_METH6|nr:hypothetical protein [Methanothrix harundinacea]AET64697.1 hypothetical protein Mhar_1333 [Methanothrix harundinacea 6Ac]
MICDARETPTREDRDRTAGSLPAILALEEEIRRRADRIGELLLVEVVRAGPDGMVCDRFDREDPLPFRIDPPCGSSAGASWHLTLTYGGPFGDALGARARWLVGGEVAAECVLDPLALAEAVATGRLTAFFDDLADWLGSEVRPRGRATRQRMEEAAEIAAGLARDLRRWEDSAGGPGAGGLAGDGIEGRDRDLRG